MPKLRFIAPLLLFLAPGLLAPTALFAHPPELHGDTFRQLDEVLPTPNVYRTASGAPGHQYWQQQVDYVIEVELDEAARVLHGRETITYHNQSPDTLRYLWVQIDQNLLRPDALGRRAEPAPKLEDGKDEATGEEIRKLPFDALRRELYLDRFDGGATVHAVTDAAGEPLPHRLVETMLRVDLPAPLAPGETFAFGIEWSYPINDAVAVRTRSGYECFDDDNCIFEIAQWFPRLAAYTDVNGWQNKQFIGRGEFALEFGDYDVSITAPADHLVTATGVLQNPEEVLSEEQRRRLEEAETADKPVFVVTPEEARANEGSVETATKTWRFVAENVRDFAWASSRKFIWDAWGYQQEAIPEEGVPGTVLAMSLYPNEAEPLWSTYSTHAIVHTLETYGRYAFPYPYPMAISVNGPVGGMEYPMICFNGPRTEDDGTYFGERVDGKWGRFSKFALISVIIHEVGHNFFPMIVNSDERQWTWMDEGINTFLQALAEQEWEDGYPSRRGEPERIVEYMVSENQVPIMTNSESLLQFGNNSYAKPATALAILRHTILGPELFDFAFREYSRRWRFKRPEPADLFRTLEDASGVDLDWFWRGWFYSTDHVDIAIRDVHLYEIDTGDPDVEKPKRKAERDETPDPLYEAFRDVPKRVDAYPELKDFYNAFDDLDPTPQDREKFQEYLETLEPWERELLGETVRFYIVDFENLGGLVMPILLEITYADGSVESLDLPAEIWRQDSREVSKLLVREKEIVSIAVDPGRETADANTTNNDWPPKPVASRFRLYKDEKPKNPMQEAKEAGGGDS